MTRWATLALLCLAGCIWEDVCVNGAERVDGRCVRLDGGETMDAGERADSPAGDARPDTACAASCSPLPNAVIGCGPAGECTIASCEDGYGDCDMQQSTGCEQDVLSTTAHCGICGAGCAPASACVAGTCRPTLRWGYAPSGMGQTSLVALAVDGDGNAYVGGSYSGVIQVGSSMLSSIGALDAVLIRLNPDGEVGWVWSGGSEFEEDEILDVAVDAAGNVYVVGDFGDTINFGGEELSLADGSGFVASFDPAGGHRWSRLIGTGSAGGVAGVTVAAGAGGVYVGGVYGGTLDLGGGALPADGSDDFFVTHFLGTGVQRLIWRGVGNGSGLIRSLTADGTLVGAAGMFYGEVDFGDGPRMADGAVGLFVVAFDAALARRGIATFGTTGGFSAVKLTTRSAGYTLLANANADVDWGSTIIPGGSASLVFLNSDATVATAEATPGLTGLVGGLPGDVVGGPSFAVTCGQFAEPTDFGFGSVAPLALADMFIAARSADGPMWARTFGSAGPDACYAMALSADGASLWVLGRFADSIDFGMGPVEPSNGGGAIILRYAM